MPRETGSLRLWRGALPRGVRGIEVRLTSGVALLIVIAVALFGLGGLYLPIALLVVAAMESVRRVR